MASAEEVERGGMGGSGMREMMGGMREMMGGGMMGPG